MENKSLIVTAGNGSQHQTWARRLVDHVNRLADSAGPAAIRAVDVTPEIPWSSLSYPPLAKLHIWKAVDDSVKRVIWIDTDTFVARAIMESDLPWDAFSAVRDPWIQGGDLAAKKKSLTGERGIFLKIPAYFNSGFYCATREAIPAFDTALSAEPHKFRKRSTWVREQDLFNWAVWKTFANCSPEDAGWNWVGEEWNTLLSKRINLDVEPVVMHLAGFSETNKRRILNGLFAGKELSCVLSS
jgi:hypothetical protein